MGLRAAPLGITNNLTTGIPERVGTKTKNKALAVFGHGTVECFCFCFTEMWSADWPHS